MKRARLCSVLSILIPTSALLAAEPDASRQLRPDAEGFIRDWLMLAPIPLEEGPNAAEPVGAQQLKNEASLRPRFGQSATAADGVERTWRAVRGADFFFDFNETLGALTEHSAGYLVTYVVCDRELKDLSLLAGGNDQFRVYLNGREAVKHAEGGALAKDAEKVDKLTLNQGVNTVVFKVLNEQNNWQGCLRFTDKASKPVTAFSLRLSP